MWFLLSAAFSVAYMVVALILLVLIILTSLIYHGYKRLAAAPGRFGSWRHGKKRSQGYEALTKGLISVAAGDGNMAGRQANKARKLLKDAPLTLLLSAQAARRCIVLTGTPALNRPVELFPLVSTLMPEKGPVPVFRNYKQFTERFCNAQAARLQRRRSNRVAF
mgnify:CR=1 FL=1